MTVEKILRHLAQYHDLIMQTGATEAILSFLNNPRVIVQTAAIRCTLLLCANGW